ncbi:MAG: hypothetical protein WEA34_08770 [Gemmatimonadota bacterium]
MPSKTHLLFTACLVIAGCNLPAMFEPPAEQSAQRMQLFMVLDPAQSTQVLLVEPVDAEEPLGDVPASLYRLEAGDTVLVAHAGTSASLAPCTDRYGRLGGWDFACAVFDASIQPEAQYLVRVTSAGRPTATATAVVPGDFEIVYAEASGRPPGTGGLTVEWSQSAHARGYFVSVRPSTEPDCARTATCPDGWFVSTVGNEVETTIPEDLLPKHLGRWILEVHALDAVLLEHLTTGSGGSLFPVPPVQNVDGGYGAVGAWASRSQILP